MFEAIKNLFTPKPDIIVQLEKCIGRKLKRWDEVKFSSVSYQFNDQQQIIKLSLYECELSELPAEIGQLQNLYLSSNKIAVLPKEILDLNLEILWKNGYIIKGIAVVNNLFETPPVEIIKQGNQAIADYYAALESKPATATDIKTRSTIVVDSKPQPQRIQTHPYWQRRCWQNLPHETPTWTRV